jgi:hypothetical protein
MLHVAQLIPDGQHIRILADVSGGFLFLRRSRPHIDGVIRGRLFEVDHGDPDI